MAISYKTKESIKGVTALAAGVAAVVYALASVFSTLVVGLNSTTESGTLNELIKRNAKAFEALPKEDTRRQLDEPQRGQRWSERQKTITVEIVDNRQPFWDFLPFMGYRFDLRDAMNRANIAVLPDTEVGKPPSLHVGQTHGCLMVDWAKAAQASADDARVLLDAFKDRADKAFDYQGTYVLGQDGKVAYTPAAKGAELPCPAWPQPANP